MDAVQLFGGNGYMTEYRVEQLARDAKSLMIYAGSNEVQITHVAGGCSARLSGRRSGLLPRARLCATAQRLARAASDALVDPVCCRRGIDVHGHTGAVQPTTRP